MLKKCQKLGNHNLKQLFSLYGSVQNQFLTKQEQKSACVPLSSFTCRNQSSFEENTHIPLPETLELIPGSQHKLQPLLIAEAHAMEQGLIFSTRPEMSVLRQTCA